MATQTRRTTRRSARCFRATLKASMVTACCGLVLWSAVAAHAAMPWNGLPFNGVPINGILYQGQPLNGMPFNGVDGNGLPFNGYPIQGMPYQGLPVNGVPLNWTPLQGRSVNEGSLPAVQRDSLPWSTVSQRPLGTSMP